MHHPPLIVQKASKKFGSRPALQDVTFAIEQGGITALIGPNGSGKTTLVKMITGLLSVSSGWIQVGGHDVATHPREAKKMIGYIPDEPSVWPMLTGYEFLLLTGKLFGMTEESLRGKIGEMLSIFQLHEIQHVLFENLSRGNRQKFCILAAMLHQPDLLVIDEPIVGLDPTSVTIFRNLLKMYVKQKRSVLLVTHNLDFAESVATQIGVLHQGDLKKMGTLAELRTLMKQKSAGMQEVYDYFTR